MGGSVVVHLSFDQQNRVLSWSQTLQILGIGEAILRNHILNQYINPINGHSVFEHDDEEYSFTVQNVVAYINTDPGGFLSHMGSKERAFGQLIGILGLHHSIVKQNIPKLVFDHKPNDSTPQAKRWIYIHEAMQQYDIAASEIIEAHRAGLHIYDSSGFVLLENNNDSRTDPPQEHRWLSIPAERLTPWTKTPYISFGDKLFTEELIFQCKLKAEELRHHFPHLVSAQPSDDGLREAMLSSPVAEAQEAPVVEMPVYNPTTANHAAKVEEAARLEIENNTLPTNQRIKRAEMAKKVFGVAPRGDRERQLRSLLNEARDKGLLPSR